jgi:hypothetical protein
MLRMAKGPSSKKEINDKEVKKDMKKDKKKDMKKSKPVGEKTPTPYMVYMKDMLPVMKKNNPKMTHTEAFKTSAQGWKLRIDKSKWESYCKEHHLKTDCVKFEKPKKSHAKKDE